MKLYHGSSADALDSMQKRGLLPRAMSKTKSNWTHTVNSNKNAVYLTDAYAFHFAANATDAGMRGLILEIDRDLLLPWLLCPDEDALEQGTRNVAPTKEQPNFAPVEWPMLKRTMHYRRLAPKLSHLADQSLEHLGTAGYYGAIHWPAVTRYVVIDWRRLDPNMRIRAVDTQVSTLNYRILADRHRAFTKWFFNDPVTAAEVNGNVEWELASGDTAEFIKRQNAGLATIMANRDGLEVVDLRERKAA